MQEKVVTTAHTFNLSKSNSLISEPNKEKKYQGLSFSLDRIKTYIYCEDKGIT